MCTRSPSTRIGDATPLVLEMADDWDAQKTVGDVALECSVDDFFSK